MAQPPAVVIIARHGMRLDAADQAWHLSTPTPYDPPLTYGGWNQSRALGMRIASLLHAREQEAETPAQSPAQSYQNLHDASAPKRRRKRKHRVVIHSSPFLRCLQTSVAIAAGMAQYEPPAPPPRDSLRESSTRPTMTRYRTAAQLYSASQKFRNSDAHSLRPHLAPIAEPKHDFAHDLARKALGEQRRYRQTKLRVDPFLGEWLNPQYFEHITPPPPSSMMLATAKAELMHTEPVDVYTPAAVTKNTSSNLWNGTNGQAAPSRESPLDDWSSVTESLSSSVPTRRERASSTSSVGSNESCSGWKSPFRPGHVLQPLTSTVASPEASAYVPPTPSYAISSSDRIPRGYVAHARNACVNVDTHWDSSRVPQAWGDGGELGEEWSSMHKRLRKGVNHLTQWYSQHNADDRGEDALGLDQADHHGDDGEEQEDLVVILVTHGAGANALIGALTNQPVLLDVGMASLTMAVRKPDAPSLILPRASSISSMSSPTDSGRATPDPSQIIYGPRRRSTLDIGLSSVYEMKIVASSEHLRPADSNRAQANQQPHRSHEHTAPRRQGSVPRSGSRSASRSASRSGSRDFTGIGSDFTWSPVERTEPTRNNTSTALGSIRRPSIQGGLPSRQGSMTSSIGRNDEPLPVFTSVGLWQPPAARTSTPPSISNSILNLADAPVFTPPKEDSRRPSIQHNRIADFSNSPPDSRSPSPHIRGSQGVSISVAASHAAAEIAEDDAKSTQRDSVLGASETHDDPSPGTLTKSHSTTNLDAEDDRLSALPIVPPQLPHALRRGLSQKGLWGSQPAGDDVLRRFDLHPKRRWSENPEAAARERAEVQSAAAAAAAAAASPPTPPLSSSPSSAVWQRDERDDAELAIEEVDDLEVGETNNCGGLEVPVVAKADLRREVSAP